jgi:chromosome segregation ATPase
MSLEIFAEAIVAAEAEVDPAAAAVEAARVEHEKIVSRVAALTAERAEIVARRARGDARADDGPALALLAADLEGLEGLRPDAEAVLASANARHRQANAALAGARAAYATAEARETISALDAHAARLLDLIGDTLRQRHAAAVALPPEARGAAEIVARGGSIEAILLAEIQAARAAIPNTVPYGARVLWKVSKALGDEITRLRLNDGRF